ncbi:MAG: MBL fold metallo-hydrolase [Ruminococcaceae bacterium]|nr:MBL fold metallo-hydrolase [Oscillospiraceae bacterium]
MSQFKQITEHIMRLEVPFENIYTAVFLINTDNGYVLVDAATTESDATGVILPAIGECGVDVRDIKYLFCTHLHGDHGGGIRFLLPHLKNAKVAAISHRAIELYGSENVCTVGEGDELCGLCVHSLFGHSMDSAGLFDKRTGTLILGDAVQLYGITRYGCGVGFPDEYRKTLLRVLELSPQMIIASHEYYPLGSVALGDGVKAYIKEAQNAFERIADFVKANAAIGDALAIAKKFTEEARVSEPDMPSLQSSTVKALL